MRNGVNVRIPIRGINNQLLDDQSVDGLCDSIVNLKPKGATENPYWVPFEKINTLKNSSGTDFSYEFGMSSITDAFWQIRNFIGEFAEDEDGSLKRLIVLCQNSSRKCLDIIDPETWEVVKTQALPPEGTYMMSCTRMDRVTIINITNNKKPFLLYYLVDDAFIPQGWPEMPSVTFSTATETISAPDISAGLTKGVMREATDQWFMVRWAFRLYDGTFVKHQRPLLVKVDSGATDEAVKPVFTLDGYTEIENILINQPFWSLLIEGISVCATLPVNDEKEALDDGTFFEIGYWPWIDKLPSDQWPTVDDPNIITVETKSDNWSTGRGLSIDEFTHHKFSANVVDTYNKRLLLGGRGVDFAIPNIPTNATKNTVPGGVYSDYMNFDSGSGGSTYRYYLNDGTETDFNSPWDYEVDEQLHISILTPKTGREFKTVTIVESIDGDEGTTTPNGQNLPYTNYVADLTTDPGNLFMSINAIQSDYPATSLPGQVAKMRLKLEIGPSGEAADEVIYFWVQPGGNQSPYVIFSSVELEADDITVGAKIYHRITIKTDSGTYYRIVSGDIGDSETDVLVPEVIWYPDRRATRYELIVENEGVFEVALDKQLSRHPNSNYSYIILSTGEQTYTIGSSLVTTTEPDLSVNDELQYIPNLVQASVSGSAFIFDSAATYRMGNKENDIIMGFGVNINKTNEGQAGQFPVFVFTTNSIWTLEQIGGDPTVAFGKNVPVTNYNGLNNPYGITNAGQLIIVTDNKYIYAVAGMDISRIDEEIANDPDYEDYLKQMRIGYHRAKDYEELIFSNPFYDYSLCYNIKYKVWYKATERFKFFFYDYPELMGLTVDNVLKDFSNKDTETPVAWSISTRPWNLGEPYELKRLFPTYLRMNLKQPLQENAEDYLPVNITLKGYRDAPNITYTLKDSTYKLDRVGDIRIYNQNGSFYAYRLIMNGTNNNKDGFIHEFDGFYETRYTFTRRRLDCSTQFLYANGEVGMSICSCAESSGTDAYFNYTGVAAESQVVTHGLNKIPGVLVTDLDGYVMDVGVQLVITEGVPSLTQIRLTFEDPQPYKAHFF